MTFKVKSSLDFLPSDYPCVWANEAVSKAIGEDKKVIGRWVSDMEYYNLWDEGWKYYNMMQYKFDEEYAIVFSTTKSSSKTKYTHVYVSVGELDSDIYIMELKILGRSNELPGFGDLGEPLNGIAWRIINEGDINSYQWGNRFYIGEHDSLTDIKNDILYITIWDCSKYFETIIQI